MVYMEGINQYYGDIMHEFYKDKKVLVTGHTGFKGSWISECLANMDADVVGYSLNPPTEPNLYNLLDLNSRITSIIGDIRDIDNLKKVFNEYEPEIVIHMAAQPIVRDSYKDPLYTYQTNVMGTVNICECIRQTGSVKSFLNVTTDKVYENVEKDEGYVEDDKLDGYDPYSNSKSCSELVTHSYNNSFFKDIGIACSTARAGNVIGGGDFANDRIIPDCVRAVGRKEDIIIRNPYSIRPYQHVLEPIFIYLTIMKEQYNNSKYAGYYNIGPDTSDCITTGELADLFCKYYNKDNDFKVKWVNKSDDGPHEAKFLKLDNNKIKEVFNWKPVWNIEKAIEKTVKWTKAYYNNDNLLEVTHEQMHEYCQELHGGN
ncbi:CDP-glucose 4,6-dehydratase [Methanosphaera sp. Vir-13MRS]|uniref:CDP-glucose 4,6-dehydratase n=1 Tax=Candidatus Methanosphaera massiliense TaxID=3017187 RepID=UPI0023807EE3|nr:CDP-glucose 4,6-dehydratase [Candidatus Methanosphaera massiliense]MDE4078801.1 CDP-glucose 4,6-dehydratase [Candidatus Methanosphaera massiliense]